LDTSSSGTNPRVQIEIPDGVSQVLLEDDVNDSVHLEIVPVESTPA